VGKSKKIATTTAKHLDLFILNLLLEHLARIFHELLAATKDMAVLPGVLGCRPLRRTVQVRLETNTLRLPGGTPICVVSPQQFMQYPGYWRKQQLLFLPQSL
jgi:hypothetical protein